MCATRQPPMKTVPRPLPLAEADDEAFLAEVDELVAKAALEKEVPTRGADGQAWVEAVRARVTNVTEHVGCHRRSSTRCTMVRMRLLVADHT